MSNAWLTFIKNKKLFYTFQVVVTMKTYYFHSKMEIKKKKTLDCLYDRWKEENVYAKMFFSKISKLWWCIHQLLKLSEAKDYLLSLQSVRNIFLYTIVQISRQCQIALRISLRVQFLYSLLISMGYAALELIYTRRWELRLSSLKYNC